MAAEAVYCTGGNLPPRQDICVACVQADSMPGSRDAEEFIEVHRVGVPELRHLLTHADVLLPTMTTCYMALERLAHMGYL
jgi:hypothetical protein